MGFADDFPELDERHFPHLVQRGYRVRSDATPKYNCLAWAAGDNKNWWEPGYYWPPGVSEDFSLESLVAAYRTVGYEICEDGRREDTYEKLAIFADSAGPTHAARQRGNGVWTSKLGKNRDIDHRRVDAVDGPPPEGYGEVVVYMRRARARARKKREKAPRLRDARRR